MSSTSLSGRASDLPYGSSEAGSRGLGSDTRRTRAQVQVRALLNDTVGTLAGGRYSDSNVVMGIILGTGTNGAYVEKISNIATLPARPGRQDPSNEMVVNTEWGGYKSPLLPMTADDYASDAAGANPGECHFEKLISGYYMGEAVRCLTPAALLAPCRSQQQNQCAVPHCLRSAIC